ncbi:hypothetical protein B0I29_11947 [Actinoplanes lutulentus]|uniref:Uncharacterized protein n=1 Tax=Actinoplanes lutulentus TaxID=1287878 RepID=A0A327Z1S8_9ACTN|nr:hypothetical protein B0I29_11947 [Actinoplanes lutulentus]
MPERFWETWLSGQAAGGAVADLLLQQCGQLQATRSHVITFRSAFDRGGSRQWVDVRHRFPACPAGGGQPHDEGAAHAEDGERFHLAAV